MDHRTFQCGTISTNGLYTAPATISADQTVTITATSQADPTSSASAVVNLTSAQCTAVHTRMSAPLSSITQRFPTRIRSISQFWSPEPIHIWRLPQMGNGSEFQRLRHHIHVRCGWTESPGFRDRQLQPGYRNRSILD